MLRGVTYIYKLNITRIFEHLALTSPPDAPENLTSCMPCCRITAAILLIVVMIVSSAHLPGVPAFLRSVKSRLKGPWTSVCNVVLGNEACDADSIISSLCYAHFKHQLDATGYHVSAASISHSDLPFRREVKLLLKRVGLDLTDLILAQDVPLDSWQEKDMLTLTLVDHNKLSSSYGKYSECVGEILDHHCDSGNYPRVLDTQRQIAFDALTGRALVGSTCTLVAEKYFESNIPMGQDVATLLLGVIALDTINMSEQAGIGTERDRVALQKLREISPCSQDELFALLRDAKLDPEFWNELSVDDVLRIDYKAFQSPLMKTQGLASAGIASALQPLKDFLRKESIRETLQTALQSQDLSMVVIMSFVHHPQPRREILLCTPNKALLDATVHHLLRTDVHDFRCSVLAEEDEQLRDLLQTDTGGSVGDPTLYGAVLFQGNAKASRKQIAPELLKFLDSFVQHS